MQRSIVVVALVATALVLGARAGSAQQTQSRIVGTITDPNGGSLPGVAVTVTSASTGAVRTAVSDEQGRYTLTNLAPGSYLLALELSGFAATRREVAVGAGDARPVDVRLALAGLAEAVTVAAEVPEL